MVIQLTCACGRKLQIKDEFAGREGTCPACGQTVDIPHQASAPPVIPYTRAVPLDAEVPLAVEEVPSGHTQEADEPLNDHVGNPLPASADLFVDPPAEIGVLVSGHSTLNRGKRPMAAALRLLLVLSAGVLGLALGGALVLLLTVENEFWLVAWPGAAAALAAIGAYLLTRFRHTCTYVGREGVARFVCTGDRETLTTQEVFRFRDATEVRTSQTMHYTNGAYTHTSYSTDWSDVGGRKRYTIAGSHKNKDGNPPAGDLYHYARAAEFAWTIYLLEQAYRQIELSGTVLFNLTAGKWIRLGPGVVVLGLSKEPIELSADDLAGANINQGVVRIRRLDAKEGWFSSRGVYQFGFNELANAQLFFHVLEKVVGIPVG